MGTYINPGNDGFTRIVSDRYVDKTGIIALVNEVVGTPRNMVCVTRPRRFGKSFAAGIQRAHDASCAPYFYNDEQALRAVVKAALISAADDYARVEELPSGHGFADVVYVPKHRSRKPALLVELKWGKPVNAAIDQIVSRDYPAVLRDLDVPIMLVGVTYDAKTKEHACAIRRIEDLLGN